MSEASLGTQSEFRPKITRSSVYPKVPKRVSVKDESMNRVLSGWDAAGSGEWHRYMDIRRTDR